MLDKFIEILGSNGVIFGEDVKTRAGDWAGQSICGAKAILRPQNTQEISQIMKICNENKINVVPAGGLTGLVHGAHANEEEIQISFERMNNIISIDPIGKTMLVEAGCPLQKIHDAAAEYGLMFAVDLGARGSCTIGGNISTNAGGNQVIRYGMMREQILGLEAVLANGTIITSLNSLLKNNAAYDLKQLFIGTEGTLGLVTQAVLRLHPKPISQNTAMVALENFEALKLFFQDSFNAFGGALSSFEVLWAEYYELLTIKSKRHKPILETGAPFYAIIETQGFDIDKDSEFFIETLEKLIEKGGIKDVIICQSKSQRELIWAVREDILGLFQLLSPLATFDVSMPIKDMENYVNNLKNTIHNEIGQNAECIVWGHLGDCNLHIIISPKKDIETCRKKIEELVYMPLNSLNGSISAEHGIGLEKRDYLHISRNENEIALMRLLKSTLDPNHILNKGKVLN